jgi:hypothetical protein
VVYHRRVDQPLSYPRDARTPAVAGALLLAGAVIALRTGGARELAAALVVAGAVVLASRVACVADAERIGLWWTLAGVAMLRLRTAPVDTARVVKVEQVGRGGHRYRISVGLGADRGLVLWETGRSSGRSGSRPGGPVPAPLGRSASLHEPVGRYVSGVRGGRRRPGRSRSEARGRRPHPHLRGRVGWSPRAGRHRRRAGGHGRGVPRDAAGVRSSTRLMRRQAPRIEAPTQSHGSADEGVRCPKAGAECMARRHKLRAVGLSRSTANSNGMRRTPSRQRAGEGGLRQDGRGR